MHTDTKFDFDDIQILTAVHTDIDSRYNDIILPETLPLFTAPMDTVVNLKNYNTFIENKINVVLPRTVSYWSFLARVILEQKPDDVFISLGFDDIKHLLTKDLFGDFNIIYLHTNAHILIDIANGHLQKVMNYCKEIKSLRPDIKIMIGNIANPQTYLWYAENQCVDYIRCSIGSGNSCLTSKNSGVGYPLASLIYETKKLKTLYENGTKEEQHDPNFIKRKAPAIIADGGMKDYSDVIKALYLGADYVMIGSIFNKALESCADNYFHGVKVGDKLANFLFNHNLPIKKHFRGMSTKEAQKAMGKTILKTSEGVKRFRQVEYHLGGWIENFDHYLRTTMSYTNCKTLDEFIGKADFIQVTDNAYRRINK